MPGNMQNHHSSSRPRHRALIPNLTSLVTLVFLVVIAVSLIFFCYNSSSSASTSVFYSIPTTRTERSFVASLEHFLTHKLPKLSLSVKDDTVRGESEELAMKLDEMVFERENRLLNDDPVGFPVKVYVYEMPRKFTYDLLWLFHNTYKETSNLTSNGSPVHRLIEQHSIDYWLWADLIAPESERRLKSVVRVNQQQDADIFYVPFFTTISFFLLEKQQCKALYRVKL